MISVQTGCVLKSRRRTCGMYFTKKDSEGMISVQTGCILKSRRRTGGMYFTKKDSGGMISVQTGCVLMPEKMTLMIDLPRPRTSVLLRMYFLIYGTSTPLTA